MPAATVTPRDDTLQWGRGCEPADGFRLLSDPAKNAERFNGAAGVNPRMAIDPAEANADALSFNGAAGVNPRIVAW